MSNIDKIRQEIERRKKENMHDELPITIGRYYEDRDFLSFLDTLPEQPVKGLKEAAGAYLDNHKPLTRYNWGDLMDAFIAGAEWQAERLLKGSPMPEDTVIFQKGIEEGKRLMMEDAVEGLICATITGTDAISFLSPLPKELTAGDKVKIVIVKED